MSDRDRELTQEEIDALAAWTVPDAPAGFADRVVSAQSAALPAEREPASVAAVPPPARRRVLPWAMVAGGGVAALLMWQLRSPSPSGDGSGSAAPSERQSVRLGRRGIAVAEAGAVLSWRIEGGRARVAQRAGDVFYRVERGGNFEVETPRGIVRVTGTCFRVELNPMKTPWQGVIGAAIGAAVVVTVYEGSVLFAGGDGGDRAISAGEVLAAGEGGAVVGDRRSGPKVIAAGEPAALPAPPQADASRDDLLRRDSVQRAEIASLRARVRDLEHGGGQPRKGGPSEPRDPSGRPWFDPSKEDLVRFAAECRVRADMPPLLTGEPFEWGPRQAKEAGLSDEERAAVNRVFAEVQRQVLAELRALYIEVTGDAARADDLSPQGMASELHDKSPEGEAGRISQRIAQERAGLATPPADPSQLSPLERFMRRQLSLGDETERRLAELLGAKRAHDLRGKEGGWGWRQETVGCPGEDEPRSPGR